MTDTYPQPDLPLTPKSAIDFLPWVPNQNYFLLPIDINILMLIQAWYDLTTSNEFLPIFSCIIIYYFINSTYSPGNLSQVFLYNDVTWSLNLIPFTCNPIWVLFPVTRFQYHFTPLSDTLLTLRGAMMGFSESLNIWDTFNDVFFPIHLSQICILPKPLFPIMGVAPPYPNFATDKIFSNPWKSTWGQSIWYPIYLSIYLYRVSCRPKCPQHHPTQ